MHYYIGLTQWHHPSWYDQGHDAKHSLGIYSHYFSSVEGNNTFYGLPSKISIKKWSETIPEHFRFCFKFPKSISHDACLLNCDDLVEEYLALLAPLKNNIGIIWLQMSQRFTPQQLPHLAAFLAKLPPDYHYGVELRHLGFFDKGATERAFNQLLLKHKVNRVIFDTRRLFANPADDAETIDSFRKKPRVPTHVVATGKYPMVRFISPLDLNLAETALDQWASKFIQWIDEGRTPYIFFHTPDKIETPQLAQRFAHKLHCLRPELSDISLWPRQPKQSSLF